MFRSSKADAGILKDVDRAIASIPADRPIRAVIQAAMVLSVSFIHIFPINIMLIMFNRTDSSTT